MKQLLLLFIFIPIIIFSQVQIGQTIEGIAQGDHFGNSLKLSENGNILVVGAPLNDGNGSSSGHVRVFEKQNGVWIQIGQDINGEALGDQSGIAVSSNSNGEIIVIGAPFNESNGSISGHVRVFENQSGIWIQKGTDINGLESSDQCGFSVSTNATGNIIAISSPYNGTLATNLGDVRIFEFINSNWVQIGEDIEGEIGSIESAWDLKLNDLGNIIAIGSPVNNNNGVASGNVRVYENINNSWVQIGTSINGSEEEWFGFSLDLSNSGNILAASSSESSGSAPTAGYVKVFNYVNNSWEQIENTIFGSTNNEGFGHDIAINSNGNIIAVSSPANDENGTLSGKVEVFELINNEWLNVGAVYGEENDESGISIDLNDEGTILAVGSPDSSNGSNGIFSGLVRVYDLSVLLSINANYLTSFKLYPNPTKNQFTIQLENPSNLQNVTIYNNLGQLVLTSKETIVDTSKLASGLYVVEVKMIRGKGVQKLIIE